ncbi:hypothetical protein B0T16DRAFT_460875 [Cercophora newfieldiana]|uniref:Uncharacterized protein n=1 Tax=Cercophora newfieldiana TaxID=92897 RepID=A0AA40CJI1_9PEZI|nr:hypothetical protein B0T16DRAFT_460875 [Cercophora newfieldiana]
MAAPIASNLTSLNASNATPLTAENLALLHPLPPPPRPQQDWWRQDSWERAPYQHKRNAPSYDAMPAPKKAKPAKPIQPLKLAASMPTPAKLGDALEIINMFKEEQAQLVDHIVKTDPDYAQAPTTIKAIIKHGERGFSMMAAAIRKGMLAACERLDAKLAEVNYKRGAVSSDNWSDAMHPFVAAIKELVDKEGDELMKLRLGYDLLWELKGSSRGDMDEYPGYGKRSSDEPADELLSDIIRKMKDAGDTWDWQTDLKRLEGEAEDLGGYGIKDWFPKSIAALSSTPTMEMLLG